MKRDIKLLLSGVLLGMFICFTSSLAVMSNGNRPTPTPYNIETAVVIARGTLYATYTWLPTETPTNSPTITLIPTNTETSIPTITPTNTPVPYVAPPVQPSYPSGATFLCRDQSYSYAAHKQGACSYHGGVERSLP